VSKKEKRKEKLERKRITILSLSFGFKKRLKIFQIKLKNVGG